MKALGRGLLSVLSAVILLMGCTSLAWAAEREMDVSQMAVLVDGVSAENAPAVVYDGESDVPSLTVVPALTHEQLSSLELPARTAGIDVYEYDMKTIDGADAHVVEVVPYNSDSMCLAVNMFAQFEPAAKAGAFLGRLQRDYGVDYIKGTLDKGDVFAEVDLTKSSLDRRMYKKALEEVTLDLRAPLVEGEDYAVSYAYGDKPGTATATITGKGDYVGTQTVEFDIDEEGAAHLNAGSDVDGAVPDASSANATALLGYVLLGFLVVAVAVIVIVLWRGAKSSNGEESAEMHSEEK